jgi:hypothetical protein
MARMVKIVQVTNFMSAIKVAQFIKSEKLKSCRLLRKTYHYESDNKNRNFYAVCLIIRKDRDIIGRKTIQVKASELIIPELYFDGKIVQYLQKNNDPIQIK